MYDKIRENFQWVGQKLKNSSTKLQDGQFYRWYLVEKATDKICETHTIVQCKQSN